MSKHVHNQEGSAGDSQGNTAEKGDNINPAAQTDPSQTAGKADQTENQTQEQPQGEAIEAELVNWMQKASDLEVKLAELNDQYLRKAADFENYRKRMVREKQELTDFANQSLISDLLPVIDDFERAIKSAETSKDFTSFYDGISMIEKRLISDLENKWELKRFDSAGQPFDPNRHEALQMEKTAGIEEPMVKEDYSKGYTLKERVIRFAKVKVLMPQDNGAAVPAADEKK